VHPSWRDLVIRELAADPAARRHFLERCGVDGLLLALSTGGGTAGERQLPLLCDDADWDTLADRLAHVVPALDDAATYRVLAALREALRADVPAWTTQELRALAATVLDGSRRRWDDSHLPVPVAHLRAWYTVAADSGAKPPQVATTWIELLPTETLDIDSRIEVARLEEWLDLADLLREHDPEQLERFRFPEAQRPVLDEIVAAAAARGALIDVEAAAVLRRALLRMRGLVPEVGALTTYAARNVSPAAPAERRPARGEPRLDSPEAARRLVKRVLADL
jgi:hypothetical protein